MFACAWAFFLIFLLSVCGALNDASRQRNEKRNFSEICCGPVAGQFYVYVQRLIREGNNSSV